MPGGQIGHRRRRLRAARLAAHYIGSFGDDELGAESQGEPDDAEGVDVMGPATVPGATNQFAVVLVDARSGERTVLWDRHPGSPSTPDDVPRDAVARAGCCSSTATRRPAAAQAARYARARRDSHGAWTSSACGPGINDLLQHIDAIIAAETFPTEFTGYDDRRGARSKRSRGSSARRSCASRSGRRGQSGARAAAARSARRRSRWTASTRPAPATRSAAGSPPACLLLAGTAIVEDVLVYANAVAALNCRALGARGAMPTAAEVDALLASQRGLRCQPFMSGACAPLGVCATNRLDSRRVTEQPLEDLLARLERERLDADRLYNDALTALNRAIRAAAAAGRARAARCGAHRRSQSRLGHPGARTTPAPTGAGRAGSGPRSGGCSVRRSRRSSSSTRRSSIMSIATRRRSRRCRPRRPRSSRRSAPSHDGLFAFQALLVQYLRTITAFVDTKDRGSAARRSRSTCSSSSSGSSALARARAPAERRWLRADPRVVDPAQSHRLRASAQSRRSSRRSSR